jgi:serine protease Do
MRMLAGKGEGTILKFGISTLVAVILALCLVLGCEMTGSRAEDNPEGSRAVTAQTRVPPAQGAIEPSPFVAVAAQVMPGVVSIDTKKTVTSRRPYGFEFDEPFGRLFRDLIPDLEEREYEVPNYASGFIFREDGYIVTNNHVVADADEIVVRLADETEYPAEVVGADPNTDIAILKVGDGNLPIVRLGDSDAINVGDWAIAIGNPFGRLEGSVTVGVISAKGRSALSIVGGTPALQDFIQTDASINFGNSGGPLVNIEGEAVGMNTAINPLGQGIGFAIPINMVKYVAGEIIASGKVSWGYMGILPQEIDKDLADALGVVPKRGILVGSVVEDSPADNAGMRRRDIIVELDGKPVSGDVDEFRLSVAQKGMGKEVDVVVLRDGDRKKLKIELGERPTEYAQAGERRERENWLGLRVDDVTGTQGSRHAPPGASGGVVVVGVDQGSPAYEEGMRVGDLIEEINGEEVDDVEDYERLTEEAREKGDKPVLFLVSRDDVNRYVAIKPSQD